MDPFVFYPFEASEITFRSNQYSNRMAPQCKLVNQISAYETRSTRHKTIHLKSLPQRRLKRRSLKALPNIPLIHFFSSATENLFDILAHLLNNLP